jgi:hypothetical protein
MSIKKEQNLVVTRLAWVAGIVAMGLSLAVVSSKLWPSRVSSVPTHDTNALRAMASTATTNGIVRQRIQSIGDIGRDGVILNSYEYPSGVISNIFILSEGNSITQVITLPTSDRWIGTKEYEEIADQDFQQSLPKDPALAELKAIFEEFPGAKDSPYFYTGLRQLVVLSSETLGVRRRRRAFEANGGDGVTFIPKHRYLTDEDWSRAYFRDRLEQQSLQIRCRERLTKIYGQMSEEIFQRLMSVKVLMVPDPLPDFTGLNPTDVGYPQ